MISLVGIAARTSCKLLATAFLVLMLVAGGIAYTGGIAHADGYGTVTKDSDLYGPTGNGENMYYTELTFDMDTGQWWGSAHPSGYDIPVNNTLVLWQCQVDGTSCSVLHATHDYAFSSDTLGYVDTSKGWAYKVCGSASWPDGSQAINYCTDLIGYPI